MGKRKRESMETDSRQGPGVLGPSLGNWSNKGNGRYMKKELRGGRGNATVTGAALRGK